MSGVVSGSHFLFFFGRKKDIEDQSVRKSQRMNKISRAARYAHFIFYDLRRRRRGSVSTK